MPITATAQPGNVPPRVSLSVSGYSSAATVTVVRVDQAGNRSNVRGANPATLSSGSWVGFDYEAPFNQPVTYVATPNSGTASTSSAATLSVSQPWLLHPGVPGLSVQARIESRGDRTHATNAGVHQILGRSTPIVISDGVRKAAAYDLLLRSETWDEAAKLTALFADTSTLLLRIAYPNTPRGVYEWVNIGDLSIAEMVPAFGSPYQRWTLPVTVCSAPSGLLQAQFVWSDVIANNATWNTVQANYPTWADLILNRRTA